MVRKKQQSVKDQIATAFADLLIEKPFGSISVSEIVERAEVARVSFYRNYSTTKEITDYIIDGIVGQIKEIILPVMEDENERNWRDFLFRYIYFVTGSEKRSRRPFRAPGVRPAPRRRKRRIR